MLTTMSSSTAPSSIAASLSYTFAFVRCPPCGNPMTVQVSTPLPASNFAASPTAYGLMHTDATLYSAATWQPLANSASVSTGWSREWSNILASSASVGVDMAPPVGSGQCAVIMHQSTAEGTPSLLSYLFA